MNKLQFVSWCHARGGWRQQMMQPTITSLRCWLVQDLPTFVHFWQQCAKWSGYSRVFPTVLLTISNLLQYSQPQVHGAAWVGVIWCVDQVACILHCLPDLSAHVCLPGRSTRTLLQPTCKVVSPWISLQWFEDIFLVGCWDCMASSGLCMDMSCCWSNFNAGLGLYWLVFSKKNDNVLLLWQG